MREGSMLGMSEMLNVTKRNDSILMAQPSVCNLRNIIQQCKLDPTCPSSTPTSCNTKRDHHTFASVSAELSTRLRYNAQRRSAATSSPSTARFAATRCTSRVSCLPSIDLARRLGRGALEPDCREEVERKMGRKGA